MHPSFEVEFSDDQGRAYAFAPVSADRLLLLRWSPAAPNAPQAPADARAPVPPRRRDSRVISARRLRRPGAPPGRAGSPPSYCRTATAARFGKRPSPTTPRRSRHRRPFGARRNTRQTRTTNRSIHMDSIRTFVYSRSKWPHKLRADALTGRCRQRRDLRREAPAGARAPP